MKIAVFLVALSVTVSAQDWKPCTAASESLRDTVESFNAAHKNGPQLSVSCQYSGDDLVKLPVRYYYFTAKESAHLQALRFASDRAFKSQNSYEKFLIHKYVHNAPTIGDKCWRYVGIVFDEFRITDDPNSGFPDSACRPRKLP